MVINPSQISIIGLSALYHDSAACLVRDEQIIAAAQEERLTRKKHDPRFPVNAIKYCLTEGGLSPANLGYVVFYEKPLVKLDRLLGTGSCLPEFFRPDVYRPMVEAFCDGTPYPSASRESLYQRAIMLLSFQLALGNDSMSN